MFDIDENLKTIILIFILLSYLIYQLKLDIMFDKNGKLKDFGTGKNKTCLPILVSFIIIRFFNLYLY